MQSGQTAGRLSHRFQPLVVWLIFLAAGLVSAPIPGVNEPHYLCKAKHFADPGWCASDVFLASYPAHWVFYAVFGPLTTRLPLFAVALVGRIAAAAILAWGWVRLTRVVLPDDPAAPLRSAALFVLATSIGNLSGEWILGGLESKVFAWGLVWAAFAAVIEGRWLRAVVWFGLAITWHPLVGGWALLAAVSAVLAGQCLGWFRAVPVTDTAIQRRLPLRIWLLRLVVAGGLLALTAAPGLWPAFGLLQLPVAGDVRYAGTYLQVYYRLKHHLDPMEFLATGYLYAGCVLALLGVLYASSAAVRKRLAGLAPIFLVALVIALAGLALGAGPRPPATMPGYVWRAGLLKFYPFRLFDGLLPVMAALGLSAASYSWPAVRKNGLIVFAIAGFAWTQWHSLIAPATRDRSPEWLKACRWIREQAPAEAVFETPHWSGTFKWYAQRAEYVSFKDCPQDLAGIVEWNRRLLWLKRWYEEQYADEVYSRAELTELRSATGITHIVTDRIATYELEPLITLGPYRIFEIPPPQ